MGGHPPFEKPTPFEILPVRHGLPQIDAKAIFMGVKPLMSPFFWLKRPSSFQTKATMTFFPTDAEDLSCLINRLLLLHLRHFSRVDN